MSIFANKKYYMVDFMYDFVMPSRRSRDDCKEFLRKIFAF